MSMAIVNPRGTSGSGKTTLVRKFLIPEKFAVTKHSDVFNKRAVDYYLVNLKPFGVQRPLAIIGSYENKCGGLDGCGSKEEVLARVEHVRKEYGAHVMCEGLLLSSSGTRGFLTQQFIAMGNYMPMFLNTPLETCLESVVQRRLAAGNDKPFNPANTENKHGGCISTMRNFDAEKVPYLLVSREDGHIQAFNYIKQVDAE